MFVDNESQRFRHSSALIREQTDNEDVEVDTCLRCRIARETKVEIIYRKSSREDVVRHPSYTGAFHRG